MTFTQAAEEHLDDVYGYLAWFTGDRAAADDLAGETFERALRLWHRFDPRARLGAHLALPGRAHGRARPLPLRAPARAARAARRRSRAHRGAVRRRALARARVRAAGADRRRARGGRAPRRARPRRRRRRQRARDLAHQLHDAPQPGAQEARGGTPCRSVISSRELRAARLDRPVRSPRARAPDRRGRHDTPRRRAFTWRRALVVALPVAAAVAATVVVTRPSPQARTDVPCTVERAAVAHGSVPTTATQRRRFAGPVVAPTPSTTRVQRYGASLALRVPTPAASRPASSARSRSPSRSAATPARCTRSRVGRNGQRRPDAEDPAHARPGGDRPSLGARDDHRRDRSTSRTCRPA